MESRRRRVPALAPEERRAALIAATIPLLHEHGLEVSTRQIASAAGVAEGTIFGVFESKSQLVVCSVLKALDPQPTLDGLAAIDRRADLRDRLAAAAELVHARFTENAHLMSAARKLILVGEQDSETHTRMIASRQQLQAAIADVFEPDAAWLRVSPAQAARLLLLFCGANAFGPYGEPESFSGEETASLLLDGIQTTASQANSHTDSDSDSDSDSHSHSHSQSHSQSHTHSHTQTHSDTEDERGDQSTC